MCKLSTAVLKGKGCKLCAAIHLLLSESVNNGDEGKEETNIDTHRIGVHPV